MKLHLTLLLTTALLGIAPLSAQSDDTLLANFKNPPETARPWVYWFWNNGNVTEKGIRADLAAMKRVGIGGAIIMDVFERFAPPPGDADYMGPKWQSLMKLALAEARRLGLEITLTNGPGWCGSSGPWITPELSMQALVTSSVEVDGSGLTTVKVPQPQLPDRHIDVFDTKLETDDFYRDIAVLAYPQKLAGEKVDLDDVIDLTREMKPDGTLRHRFPEGKWTIRRFGHTSTGASTRPPVKGGNGLECDKFSAEAIALQFDKVVGMLENAVPAKNGRGLVATHVDSWEVGHQSWTARFPEEFRRRRGYDLTKYLPNLFVPAGQAAVATPGEADRFRWDFYQTCSELLSENYIGALAYLAHERGMRLSLEGYNLPFGDEANYTTFCDEPMTEFWSTGGAEDARKCHEMASVGHVMGRRVIGAEAFTASQADEWTLHPALVKTMGDYQMSQGVNKFVIHRYAMQPYNDRFPGTTMGPWGLHYERTNTWWNMTGSWHDYLSRCQYLLRQGHYVADVLYLRHQHPNQTYFTQDPPLPAGYRSDDISALQLISRASVKDGRIVLPDGMSYRLLVVPNTPMTPALVGKIAELAEAGATIYGPRPVTSPSLQNYPACDTRVAGLAAKAWGDCDGGKVTEHRFGEGRIVLGRPFGELLEETTGGPDFNSETRLNWIHRHIGGRDAYFIANPTDGPVAATCDFRVGGKNVHLWHPETGEVSKPGLIRTNATGTRLELRMEQGESFFVVFSGDEPPAVFIAGIERGEKAVPLISNLPDIEVLKARYGPSGDAARTIDAKGVFERLLQEGRRSFKVSELAHDQDPAYGTVKTLELEIRIEGETLIWSGTDPQEFDLLRAFDRLPAASIRGGEAPGSFILSVRETGDFGVKTTTGNEKRVEVAEMERPLYVAGPWTVEFPRNWGAPSKIQLAELISLSSHEDEGVRHFSGVSTYRTVFDYPDAPSSAPGTPRYWLDLGQLQVMGEVTLNGKPLGTVWNRPARIEVTPALHPGRNELVIRVANLWPNRMIGDTSLPEGKRFTWSSYQPFKPNSPLPPSGLIGPVRIETEREIVLTF
ncbi:glycosyl hydrolase [Haloferula sargassicola]|uniref:Beta-mannosidase-like galactose-binding domain-containing protein n=1 Tax=Haloferula sargassicola TaxID=490096 RepID=A0ABP9UMR2_9BACT